MLSARGRELSDVIDRLDGIARKWQTEDQKTAAPAETAIKPAAAAKPRAATTTKAA